MTQFTPHVRPAIRHSGLTLLEVLVALALSTALLGAVYVALDLHWKYSTAGRDDAERSQLARALANRLAVDLRSVVYRQKPADEAAADSSSGSEAPSESTESTAETQTPAEDPATDSDQTGTGLFGNSHTVMVHLSQPSRTLEYSALVGGQQSGPRTSDLLTVSWFVARQGAGGLQGAAASQGEGLARSAGDRLATQLADESGNLQSLASQVQVLAPEVTAVGFKYFDGAAWRADWDSDVLGGLPRAVEILFEIRPSANQKDASEAPRQYRLVVPLPLAQPLPV